MNKTKTPVTLLKVKSNEVVIPRSLVNMNKTGEHVKELQIALAYLGYQVSQDEFKNRAFGSATLKALNEFQASAGLDQGSCFDSRTRKALKEALVKKNSNLNRVRKRFVVKGSVRDEKGTPLEDCIVTVSYTWDGREYQVQRATNKKGFYHVQFYAPKNKAGIEASNLSVYMTVTDKERRIQNCSSTIQLSRSAVWKNFGTRPSVPEFEQVMDAISKTWSVHPSNLFVPNLKFSIQDICKATGKSEDVIEALYHAYCLCDAINKIKLPAKTVGGKLPLINTHVLTAVSVELVYAAIRKGALENLMSPTDFALAKGTGAFAALTQERTVDILKPMHDSNLKVFLLTDAMKLQAAVEKAQGSNVIGADFAASINIDNFKKRRNEYILRYMPMGNAESLADILEDAGIPENLYDEAVDAFVKVGDLGDGFVAALPSAYTSSQRRAVSKVIALYDVVGSGRDAVKKLFAELKGVHEGCIAMLGDAKLSALSVEDVPALRERIKEKYPDYVYIDSLYKMSRSQNYATFKRDEMNKAIDGLYEAVRAEYPEDRFVLADSKMTDTYVFDKNDEANDKCRTNIRKIQRLYKISKNADVTLNLLKEGVSSAVAAYYKGRAELGVSEEVWRNIESLYWKTITLYNDIVDAAKDSSRSVIRSSANLRNLFGSVDSYVYDESLSLLSPAAYLVDLLRYLHHLQADGIRNVYKTLVSRRPEIPNILLNKDNSEMLVPQIDIVCEILESMVGKEQFALQTSGDQEEVLAIPQHTNETAYRNLAESGYPSYNPYFNLPQTQIREILKELGVPRYELMKLAGYSDEQVAAEYFGMSRKCLDVFDGSLKTATWNLDSSVEDGVTCIKLNDFLAASGLEYADAVSALSVLDINLSDPDPDGYGFPDTERQMLLLRDKEDDMLRVQRFVIMLKLTGLSPKELKECVDAPEIGAGEMDAAFLVKLMKSFESKESDGDSQESVLVEYFRESEVLTILEKSVSALPGLAECSAEGEERGNALCKCVAQSYKMDVAVLEKVYEACRLDEESLEAAASALMSSAIICNNLSASVDDLIAAMRVYGCPNAWDRHTLEDLVTVLVFNQKYKLDGKTPLVANPKLNAQDCRRAEKVLGYLQATGIESEGELLKYAEISSYLDEEAKAAKLLEILKYRTGKLSYAEVRTVMDRVRVAKRDALTGYLLSGRKLKGGNADDLLDIILLDVKVGPEQETTRIKMATNAVQLFVQRCMLGLEEDVTIDKTDLEDKTSADNWSQWTWLKNYRVWEAARKIFLFPENWIDPELRDGQTPEFVEFLDGLDEIQLDEDKMADVISDYLYKLDNIANLEACAMYRQNDVNVDVWHIIARTRTATPTYYYRTHDNRTEEWTAWEKIDIEIEGDQVVPVVYNNRLYLFWLKFYQKALKVEKAPGSDAYNEEREAPKSAVYYEIQLAWTSRKGNSWTPFCVGKKKLIHPWDRPRYSYDMKPFIDGMNRLHLDIYLGMSEQFNGYVDNTAMDYYKDASYRFSNRSYVENSKPWHSSTFIFEGDVTDVLMKDLQYNGKSSINYVHKYFGEDGAAINSMKQRDSGPQMFLPDGMHMRSGRLVNNKRNPNYNTLNALEVVPELLDRERLDDLIGHELNRLGVTDKALISRLHGDFIKSFTAAGARSRSLLLRAQHPFELVMSKQDLQMNSMQKKHMMVYQDQNRSLFFKTSGVRGFDYTASAGNRATITTFSRSCRYDAGLMYHPYARAFIKVLREKGIDGIFERELQLDPWKYDVTERSNGNLDYAPTAVVNSFPVEDIDFNHNGAYSMYNWELFFHMPLTVACRLSQNQKFEEAMKWFHFIFNPVVYAHGADTPECYWKTKPFYQAALRNKVRDSNESRIETLLGNISGCNEQLAAWKNNPFSPHILARYRTTAYQKTVVLKYIENLINWADMKFREDTMESINEATQLYLLAFEILGKRPCKVAPPKALGRYDMDFKALIRGIDEMGNSVMTTDRIDVLLKTESLLDPDEVTVSASKADVPVLDVYYFDVPENEQIESYWDIVEDRLAKIRASLNIDGIFRKVSVNAPEIDPAAMVKAAFSSYDSLNEGTFPPMTDNLRPPYKFRTVLSLAEQMCSEVRQLGDKFLSAVEKMDAEALAHLRADQEWTILKNYEEIRKSEIKDIEATIASLELSLARAEYTKEYYESQEVSKKESKAMAKSQASSRLVQTALPLNAMGATLSAAGSILAGFAGLSSPLTGYTVSFQGIGQGMAISADSLQMLAGISDRSSSLISVEASYERRQQDWTYQATLAKYEIDSITHQLEGARQRLQMAERNLAIHYDMVSNAKDMMTLMETKFTKKDLYKWMKTELFKSYTKAYGLAYELAKKAEVCYEFERGENPGIIKYDSWNSERDGLLAGDLLMQKINQLKVKYYDNNKRDYELIKHIPLSNLPSSSVSGTGSALLDLIYNGECEMEIPEWMYDMDYEKHYFRTIKNVSLNIPCIVGPHTNVNCTLSMTGEAIRKESKTDAEPLQIKATPVADSMATSTAVNDSGVFEVNFNDERYLPFEGYGAVSRWRLSLPLNTNHFDRTSISDVIMNICYTSRLETMHESSHGKVKGRKAVRVFSVKHDLQAMWRKIQNGEKTVDAVLADNMYPYWIRPASKSIMSVFAETSDRKTSKKVLTKVEARLSLDQEGNLKADFAGCDDVKKWTDLKIIVDAVL